MHLRPIEHLDFRKPQNAHTRKTAYTLFCILQLFYKVNRNRTNDSFQNRTETETEPNPQFFSEPNWTELKKSIPHIPTIDNSLLYW